jgi:hypothetical protein
MITGAHSIIYSTNPDADRAFLRDVLELPHVEVGGGWLIFGLPPAEVAVHPADSGGRHELYLLCDDVAAFVAEMQARNVPCGPVTDQRWGLLTEIALPGGGKLGVYEPRHARPPQLGSDDRKRASKKASKRASKKASPKVAQRKLAKRATKPAFKRAARTKKRR